MGSAGSVLQPSTSSLCERLLRSASEQLLLHSEVGDVLTALSLESAVKDSGQWQNSEISQLIFGDEQSSTASLLLLLKLFVDNLQLNDLPAIDEDEMMPVELSSLDDCENAIKTLQGASAYSIVAENAGFDDLSFLTTFGSLCLPPLLLRHLNVSGNNVSELDAGVFSSHSCLSYLQIGGNPITSMSSLTQIVPSTIIVLDVSFTENIVLEPGCFLHCPQLIRLSLDGCSMATTMHGNDEGDKDVMRSSVFAGLVSLKELSLKENELSDNDSIAGLFFFALTSGPAADMTIIKHLVSPTLTQLWLDDNPISDSQSALRDAKDVLITNIPSLKFINNVATVKTVTSGTFDVLGEKDKYLRHAHAMIPPSPDILTIYSILTFLIPTNYFSS